MVGQTWHAGGAERTVWLDRGVRGGELKATKPARWAGLWQT